MRRWIPRSALLILPFLFLAPTANAKKYEGNVNLDSAWYSFSQKADELKPAFTFPYENCFERSAKLYDLPLVLLLALARGESDFNAKAKSHANARGLMQILWPATAHELGIYDETELYEPCTNVDAGARYLKGLLQRYDGNIHLSLAAYNYGPGRISEDKRMPNGAEWYSGYIYNHLKHVVGASTDFEKLIVVNNSKRRNYLDDNKKIILRFRDSDRALSFLSIMQRKVPGVRLDMFRSSPGLFSIRMFYDDEKEYNRSAKALKRAGFDPELS